MTPEQRFWSHVRRDEGCWPWLAHRSPKGYGMAWSFPRHRVMQAHRVAWEWSHGRIPDGLCVLHRCDSPPCCNPDHLFLGTNADNVADKVAKGRQARHKLTAAQRVEITIALGVGHSQHSIARQYGVSPALINRIAKQTNVNSPGAAA